MSDTILQEFESEIKLIFSKLEKEIRNNLDFSAIEIGIIRPCNKLVSRLLEKMLNELLRDKEFLMIVRKRAGNFCLKYKEYRDLSLRLWNGETIKISSPYFISTKIKSKKRVTNVKGNHFVLDILGIIEHCSPNFVSEVVSMALLCPSLEVSRTVLSRRGIDINVKTIRRLCGDLGETGIFHRGNISLSGDEDLKGKVLVIGIDGGRLRLRERHKKPVERKEGQKRDGFSTDWKEPKLFTIYLIDEKGAIVKEFPPLHDATMESYEMMFTILERYLSYLNIESLDKIVFCGDGSPTIWQNVEKLLSEMDIQGKNIFQVLDYTHAKQNLRQITAFAPIKERINLEKETKELLWKGDIEGIFNTINKVIKNKAKRGKAIKKWENYFKKNESRMQYEKFKKLNIPCGSGCVESAIRRVINLRLKAPGTFWTKKMAESFLFLRSQLISGRWDIFINNITNLKRKFMFYQSNSEFQSSNKQNNQIFNIKNYDLKETFSNAA